MTRLSGIRSIMQDIAASGVITGARTEVLNLSPGNPSYIPEVVETWARLTREALDEHFVDASTRYGPSRGMSRLVEAVVGYFNCAYGWCIGPENIVVGPGSQMLSFLAAALYSGPARTGRMRSLVLPRTPDYTGYQGLSLDAGAFVGVEPRIEACGARSFRYQLDENAVRGVEDIGMLLISNPSNPSGSTIDEAELSALIDVAERNDAPLVIDHAYGEPFPRIAPTGARPVFNPYVINLFTFSKAGIPAERMAFAIGPEHLIEPMVNSISNSALHAPQLMQCVVAKALSGRHVDTLTANYIVPYYERKYSLARNLLAESMPEAVNWRMHSGERGMFCWLTVDDDWFNDVEFYGVLKKNGVFIVPGRYFFAFPAATHFLERHATRCFRISLSPPDAELAEGIRRIGQILGELAREKEASVA